jgi:hypothetical protein
MHYVDLIGLDKMLSPMSKYNHHKELQCPLMPAAVELLVKTGIWRRYYMQVGKCRV